MVFRGDAEQTSLQRFPGELTFAGWSSLLLRAGESSRLAFDIL